LSFEAEFQSAFMRTSCSFFRFGAIPRRTRRFNPPSCGQAAHSESGLLRDMHSFQSAFMRTSCSFLIDLAGCLAQAFQSAFMRTSCSFRSAGRPGLGL